jgi:hypothetical protein
MYRHAESLGQYALPLRVGEEFKTVLCGYGNDGLLFGWNRPKGMENEKPIRIKIGEPGPSFSTSKRNEEYEAGAQSADRVKVEITAISNKSAYARVKERLGCTFEHYSHPDGRFHNYYQKDKKGMQRSVQLTGHSSEDVRDAVSHGGPVRLAGFMGVTTMVKHARYSSDDLGRICPVRLDNWYVEEGKYRINARPANAEDKRDVTKEIWVAEYDLEKPRASDISYRWLHYNFKGIPRGISNALIFDGKERMFIVYHGGVSDISNNPLKEVADNFFNESGSRGFRLVVATQGSRAQIEDAIGNSSLGLKIQRFPSEFCPSITI